MTVDVDDLSVSSVDNHVTAAITHHIKDITSTFNSHFRDADIYRALVVVANRRLQVTCHVTCKEGPR